MTTTKIEKKISHKVTLTNDQVRDILLHYVGAPDNSDYVELRADDGDAIYIDFQVVWVISEQIDVELAE